jgi:predicted nucleotidyltransferase
MPSIKPDYPLDSIVLAVMREMDALIREMKLSYFVCGAVARDILLHHIHGIQTGRTTADVDFAVAVESWEQFYEIKDRLIKTGRFKAAGGIAQRLYYRSGSSSEDYPLDIIPFGKVENPPNSIKWPPDGNEMMSVIGYADVLATTVEIEVEKNLLVPVISLAGLALLKLFAWRERGTQNPKDAPIWSHCFAITMTPATMTVFSAKNSNCSKPRASILRSRALNFLERTFAESRDQRR